MYCKQARLQLRHNEGKTDPQFSDDLFDHLTECHDCWDFASSLWESEAVSDTAELNISPLDVDSALNRAWNAHTSGKSETARRPLRHLAAAAMVVVAVSAVLLQFWNNGSVVITADDPATIVATPASVRQVNFMLTSAELLNEATITLALDNNLELSGYPGMKEFSWMTTLQAGDNQLTLPLQLQNEEQGVITVNVESNGLQKQMMFTVQPPQTTQHSQVI